MTAPRTNGPEGCQYGHVEFRRVLFFRDNLLTAYCLRDILINVAGGLSSKEKGLAGSPVSLG